MKDRQRQRGLAALDLLEEAVHLLRTAPGSALGWYFLGAMPFVVVLLYFWTEMSWSADARSECAVDALFVALAFCWMKFCQAMFTRKLGAQLKVEPDSRVTFRASLRILAQQAIIQPSKLFILPVALIITIPFAWVCAFYENVTAFGEAKNLRALWSRSWKQARLWPRQNHVGLSIFVLFALIMFVNILIIVMIAPHFLKMFTGAENLFTRSGMHVLNSTILAVVGSLTYLCCDPLLKAVYVLRCFYGESLQSGEDLQVEVRRLRVTATAIAAVFCVFTANISLFAAPPSAPPAQSINVSELDRSINDTIAKPEFSWRMPREGMDDNAKDKSPNAFDRFVRKFFHTLGKWWRSLLDFIDRLMPKTSMPSSTPNAGAGAASRDILEISLIVLCAALIVFLIVKIRDRILQNRRAVPKTAGRENVDLAEESVTADQLPEDEWLRLAREMIARGEWRLALRAFFLAGLAHLSQRGLIALARHKSNRDYQSELNRRAPAQPTLHDAFAQNLRVVERTWYGRHEVKPEMVEAFQSNLEQLRAL
jgi:hypothetical protein